MRGVEQDAQRNIVGGRLLGEDGVVGREERRESIVLGGELEFGGELGRRDWTRHHYGHVVTGDFP